MGIVTSADFFRLDRLRCLELLEEYDWVEFKAPRGGDFNIEVSATRLGFQFADLQLHYKASCLRVPTLRQETSLELNLVSARANEFKLVATDITEFSAERFALLPGITPNKICERYVAWANMLLKQNPELCFKVCQGTAPQGWVFTEPGDSPCSLNFTLAMTSKETRLRGVEIYAAAIKHFADIGFTFCQAAFSAFNVPAHNIHAFLGARFLEPVICWLWINPKLFRAATANLDQH